MKTLKLYPINERFNKFIPIDYCDKFEVTEIVNVVDENGNIVLEEATILEIKNQFWDGKSEDEKWKQNESEPGFKHWVKFDK